MRWCEVDYVTSAVKPPTEYFLHCTGIRVTLKFPDKTISETHFINCFTVQMVADIIEKNDGIERCLEDVYLCSV